ncbi:hypothetical protein [Pandoraea sputorum]|uniref:hypothetical protein n=1 Tax=Pandoraea sputorum TaxID=93222 RepID=UPI00355694F4
MFSTYKGFRIAKGRCAISYSVRVGGRTRWGTLAEVRQDVDDFLAGRLAIAKAGCGHA